MDPLSVASGVAGLVTLADVVISRAYNTIIACKHASEDSRRLLREVQALVGILQSLSSLESKLGATALQSHIPAAQILSCQQTLQNIRDKLEKSDPKEDGISIFQKAKRTLKWPLGASDTEKFLAEMERHKATFDLALSVDALDAILSSQEAREKTDTRIDRVVQTLDRLCKIEDTKEQRRALQLIGAGDADEAYRANLKLHQHGTGLWFLEENKPFCTWLAASRSKLWVYGIPGAGKTILSALAIGKAAELASTTHGVAFYYCSHRDERSRHLSGILRCLVGQLARQNSQCMTILEEKFGPQDHTSSQSWMRNDDELGLVLRRMIRRFTSVSLLVDGVDECHEATTVTDALESLASETPGVRIVIFSRKETAMEPFLGGFIQVSIAAESQDLRLYVPAQIELRTRLRKLRIKDPNVKDKIIDTLVNEADGMFRWVACQLDHLCDLTTDDERLRALKELPRTLESTYDRILERANDRGESACALVQRSLLWIVHRNKGPLNINQLCEAVSIDSHTSSLDPRKIVDAEEILIVCSSLIRLTAHGDAVESAHFTVEEYLRAIDPVRKPHLARYHLSSDIANDYKATTCLTALLFEDVTIGIINDWDSLTSWLRQFPFYLHATKYWANYCNACKSTKTITSLSLDLLSCARSNFKAWAHLYLLSGLEINHQTLFSAIFAASSRVQNVDNEPMGSTDSSQTSNCDGYSDDLGSRNAAWMKALQVAEKSSSLHFAAMLHQACLLGPLAQTSGDTNMIGVIGTPLHCALLGPNIFSIVVEDFDSPTNENEPLTWPPVGGIWFDGSVVSSRTVSTLLGLGADVNIDFATHGIEATTTSIAAWTGHLAEILGAGARLDQETAYWLCGNADGVADDEVECIRDMDPSQVSTHDRPYVLRLLKTFESLSDLIPDHLAVASNSLTDGHGRLLPGYENEFSTACASDDLSMLQWIIESSAVGFDYQTNGGTALQKACSCSATSVAEYLILNGAQLDEMGVTDITPLGNLLKHDARYGNSVAPTLTLLIDHGADIYKLDRENNSILMYWAGLRSSKKCGLDYIKEILVIIASSLPDLAHQNSEEETVWHILARSCDGHHLLGMLTAVISEDDIKTSVNLTDKAGLTALHVAASNGYGELMQALVDCGCELTTRTPDGKTVLHLSAVILDKSDSPFEIALGANWDDTARSGDGTAALIDWAVALCEDHRDLPTDMAERLRNAVVGLSAFASTTTNAQIDLTACVDIMARSFANKYVHDATSCAACNTRIECFIMLLRGPNDNRVSDEIDLICVTTLSNGLRRWVNDESQSHDGESICSKAIRAILDCRACAKDLHRVLKTSCIIDAAVSSRQTTLIEAFLNLDIDVDERGFCKNELTILERLCQLCAPDSVVRTALSRTKRLQARTDAGDTLLHLLLLAKVDKLRPRAAQETVTRLLVEAGVDVNARSTRDGRTALMLSMNLTTPATLKLLLENNADVTLKGFDGWDALLLACESGLAECVSILLSFAKPFVYGRLWVTEFREPLLVGPFQAATISKSIDVLETLYELTEIDEAGETRLKVPSCLWIACLWSSNLEQVQYILKKGADVNYRYPKDGTTPLHNAAAVGSVDVLEALLEAGSDCCARDQKGFTAEMHATSAGQPEAAEVLRVAAVEASATQSVSPKDQRLDRFSLRDTLPDLIDSLIAKGDLPQLKNFVTAGSDLSLRFRGCKCTPMMTALAYGQVEIVTYLQSLGIKLVGMKCCSEASPCGTRLSALDILPANATLLAQLRCVLSDEDHMITPLDYLRMMHTAAANGNTEALKLILAVHRPAQHLLKIQRADILAYLISGGRRRFAARTSGTVLHTAVQGTHHECVSLLLEYYSDTDILSLVGQMPSHMAASWGDNHVLSLLLSHGSNVNARNAKMETPLFVATKAGHLEVVRTLLRFGADATVVNNAGQTLYYAAGVSGNPRVSSLVWDPSRLPSAREAYALYRCRFRAFLMHDNMRERFEKSPIFMEPSSRHNVDSAILRIIPLHCRRLNLTLRRSDDRTTVLYHTTVAGCTDWVKVLLDAGAMINQQGGSEGTPLMGACQVGRLEVVKYLVSNGALIYYEKHGDQVSAFAKAACFPKIQRWLLVERFTEQRMILDGEIPGEQAPDSGDEDTCNDEIAGVTLDLVLDDDVEGYLESKNWFLPMRRFVDDGYGAFVRVPIPPEEFARYRPLGFKIWQD